MAPKDAIMNLPTEVVENIASRLSKRRLLAFRRAHPQLADRSSDTINDMKEHYLPCKLIVSKRLANLESTELEVG